MQEFYSKRGFYEWNFIVTCQAFLANSNWRLGSWFESLENSLIGGGVQRLRISVVKTFWAGFHVWLEVFFFCFFVFFNSPKDGIDFVYW